MVESIDSYYRVAVHTAGHAVIAWTLGRGISQIAIAGDSVHRGHTEIGSFEMPPPLTAPEDLRRWRKDRDRMYLVAGSIAEMIAFGDHNSEARSFDAGVSVIVDGYLDESKWSASEKAAETALLMHWSAVVALAEQLRHPPLKLDGRKVELILQEAGTEEQLQQRRERSA
ncbi:MAG TPA: hypothetical protein VFH48_06135 [Chloroflexota bacterium]|nr:hypothetical protein [Chloroflexota bacterium]